jgi:hypothetical protein
MPYHKILRKNKLKYLSDKIIKIKSMRIKINLILLFTTLCTLISCSSKYQKNNSIKGIWKSVGYGKILKIDSTTYKYFDITVISCLPSKEGNISEIKNGFLVRYLKWSNILYDVTNSDGVLMYIHKNYLNGAPVEPKCGSFGDDAVYKDIIKVHLREKKFLRILEEFGFEDDED